MIEYDGTRFFGWQRQTDKPTIQGELERLLSIILNQEIKIHGSGRTDAGVHARAQVAHFHARTAMTPGALKKGLNSMMRHPIVVHDCHEMPADFHAQYHVKSKEYRYYILNRREPCAVGRDFVWHVNHPLDIKVMNQCCQSLVGVHDFKAFENTGSPRSSTIREVYWASWTAEKEKRLVFSISASGFLKNMVRNIVGTLKDAGAGKITPVEFQDIMSSCQRPLAGATAPARGLFLHKVIY
ncbi:MAG: tRNA pseudouridine(38-40) synthase TruA [Desulfobacter sp.]|nr:MAG: tRNA pseudouridine(38-40) synthase TruA [Desulfobacter sp.]